MREAERGRAYGAQHTRILNLTPAKKVLHKLRCGSSILPSLEYNHVSLTHTQSRTETLLTSAGCDQHRDLTSCTDRTDRSSFHLLPPPMHYHHSPQYMTQRAFDVCSLPREEIRKRYSSLRVHQLYKAEATTSASEDSERSESVSGGGSSECKCLDSRCTVRAVMRKYTQM